MNGKNTSRNNKIRTDERIASVRMQEDRFTLSLYDGRELSIPLKWFPRLARATPEEREDFSIRGAGFAIRWERLDEDLSVEGLLAGLSAPEVRDAVLIDSNTITKYRGDEGLTQAELAKQLGVRQATVSDWEQGNAVPSPLARERLEEMIRKRRLLESEIAPRRPANATRTARSASELLLPRRALAPDLGDPTGYSFRYINVARSELLRTGHRAHALTAFHASLK